MLKEEDYERLEVFVTDVRANIFALRGLPEVVKGALFSRYSRSTMGLRELLLKEFLPEESAKLPSQALEGILDEEKASQFYDRVLDGYGDDSIGELGGAHLAVENVSMLGAKIMEDRRIGGSPLEKSTRYVFFDQKVSGDFSFYKDPVLLASEHRDRYLSMCRRLFEAYKELFPPLMEKAMEQYPRGESVSKGPYMASIRAHVLDIIRGLLPTSTLTNVGVFGNGRFFEYFCQKLLSHPLTEAKDIGEQAFGALSKVIPSFVRRAKREHKHCQSSIDFQEHLQSLLSSYASVCRERSDFGVSEERPSVGVRLVDADNKAIPRMLAALLFPYTDLGMQELLDFSHSLSREEVAGIFESINSLRKNRRHKAPRGCETSFFTLEIICDFGAYRDLQRHRMLTQERQLITCQHGFDLPWELQNTPFEETYRMVMEEAALAHEEIASDLPYEAQYVAPMGYKMRWLMHVNLRALQWLCELRSGGAGHPSYRYIAQEIIRCVCKRFPELEPFFCFADMTDPRAEKELGRLEQESRSEKKKQSMSSR